MIVRLATIGDLSKIEELFKKSGHDFDKESVLASRVVVNGDRILGYGSINVIAESVITVDPELSTMIKSAAIKKLLDEAIHFVKEETRMKEIHAYAKPEFAKILIKHFGFIPILEEALFLELKNG